jgi:phosphoglucomutase
MPDMNFSTVKYPNPEEPEVFEIGIRMAKENGADLIIGTDPDCDRVGVVVKNNEGNYVVLTGNQVGVLLTNYMLSQLKRTYKLPEGSVVVKTIVTTELARRICEDYKVEIIDVLTGFKYIGEKIKEFEGTSKNFIIGFEESFGYLAGTFVRDKDAVIASALICEMAAFYKSRGMSLYDGIIEIYEKYGYCAEGLSSITLKGIEGNQRINEIMEELRSNTPDTIAVYKVVKISDYFRKIETNILTGEKSVIELPKSNVIQLFLEDGGIVTARPSGTEPKIKFYIAAVGRDLWDAEDRLKKISDEVLEMIK